MEDMDRISKLPDTISSHILYFLSTKEAARTSVLSTRWRYLFALSSTLDFDLYEKLFCEKLNKSYNVESFMSFVDRVLFLHNKANVDKFRLRCAKPVYSSRVYGWICAAIWRMVKHLDLSFSGDKLTLPGVLFAYSPLVTLKLESSFVLDVPKGVHFPNLKTLHLKSVEFLNDDSVKSIFSNCTNLKTLHLEKVKFLNDSVQSIFSNCTSLEDVVIENWNMKNMSNTHISHHFLKRLTLCLWRRADDYRVIIDPPNLAYFKCSDIVVTGYSVKNLESIVTADICILMEEEDKDLQAEATAFFRGISRVRSLVLSCTSLELLLSCESLPGFATLEELKLRHRPLRLGHCECCCSYYGGRRLRGYFDKGIETLLSSSPELEQLAFNQRFLVSLPENVPSCLLFKLKAIQISNFEDSEDCIRKAKYILENGGALQKLSIRAALYLDGKRRRMISEVLLSSSRKSEQCRIVVI